MRGATQVDEVNGLVRSISIHAPRAGRDFVAFAVRPARLVFQSTRPVRGATRVWKASVILLSFQSTRPVRGATPPEGHEAQADDISIHAPRAGRDV